MNVKYNAPGWENRVGKVHSITKDTVVIEFGRHDFVEVPREDVIFLTLKRKVMKTICIMFIWTLAFVMAALSVSQMGVVFWVSFAVFAASSVYVQRNQKRLLREVDKIFNEKDEDFV